MTDKMDALREAGQVLLDAGIAYHQAAMEAERYGAVIWLTGTAGDLVIVTRGEYRERLLQNIEATGPTHSFGSTVEEEVSR